MLARALELVSNLPEAERTQTEPQLLSNFGAQRMATFDARDRDP
jgi:hypothetical protein